MRGCQHQVTEYRPRTRARGRHGPATHLACRRGTGFSWPGSRTEAINLLRQIPHANRRFVGVCQRNGSCIENGRMNRAGVELKRNQLRTGQDFRRARFHHRSVAKRPSRRGRIGQALRVARHVGSARPGARSQSWRSGRSLRSQTLRAASKASCVSISVMRIRLYQVYCRAGSATARPGRSRTIVHAGARCCHPVKTQQRPAGFRGTRSLNRSCRLQNRMITEPPATSRRPYHRGHRVKLFVGDVPPTTGSSCGQGEITD